VLKRRCSDERIGELQRLAMEVVLDDEKVTDLILTASVQSRCPQFKGSE
jgi:hypothetical protein